MPTFLSDPSPTLYLLLVMATVVAGIVALRHPSNRTLGAVGVAGGLLVLVFLFDMVSESPREAAVDAVHAMTAAANARDRDAFCRHLGDPFTYVADGGKGKPVAKAAVRQSGFWDVLEQYNVRTAAWDFSRDDVKYLDPDTVEIGFLAKGETPERQVPLYFRATFARGDDGTVKLTRLASFDPLKRTNEPVAIPFFP